MKTLHYLDIDQSIRLKKLVFKWDWETITDKIMIYFICFVMLFNVYLIGKFWSDFQWVWAFGLIVFYIIYRNITEYQLTEIITKNIFEKNEEIILKYGQENDYEILKIDKKLLVLDYVYDNGLTIITTSTLFFFEQEKVYMVTIRENSRIRMKHSPVLISHLFLRQKIKKLLLN